jgi:hypothetical protein
MADAASARGEGVEGGQGGIARPFRSPNRLRVEVAELDQTEDEDQPRGVLGLGGGLGRGGGCGCLRG